MEGEDRSRTRHLSRAGHLKNLNGKYLPFFVDESLITATGLCELANYTLNNCHKTILLSEKTKCQGTKADNVERQMFKILRFLCQCLF